MYRFIVALFFTFLSVADLSAKVYPDDGPLFDPSSPECAVGRPLSEVLNELVAQITFLEEDGDYFYATTSDPDNSTYYDLSRSEITWPHRTSTDSILYISYLNQSERANCGINDTSTVFGIYFTPGVVSAKREVKAIWLKYIYIMNIESDYCTGWKAEQDKKSIAPYLSSKYVQEKIMQGDCLKPYSTYQLTVEGDTLQLRRGDGFRTFDSHENCTVKTELNTVSSLTKGTYKREIFGNNVQFNYTQNYVGNLVYCPVTVEIDDTLCRGDLPDVYKTKITKSYIDSFSTVKTWYGVDSMTILHIIINEPSQSDYDSVSYSKLVSDTIYKDIEKVYTNAVGCDSVVTCHLKIIPIRDTVSFLPVIPDKFFTPNGDGINDTWNIQNISQYENYVVCIYDRHGKLLMKYRGNFSGWNGIYNGEPQPSTDYWYTITIDDSDEEFSGHFTLIR